MLLVKSVGQNERRAAQERKGTRLCYFGNALQSHDLPEKYFNQNWAHKRGHLYLPSFHIKKKNTKT